MVLLTSLTNKSGKNVKKMKVRTWCHIRDKTNLGSRKELSHRPVSNKEFSSMMIGMIRFV
jgi:hypothetical protein